MAAAALRLRDVSFISPEDAAAIDEALMGPLGFSVDQLMELAGLSCACAIAEVFPAPAFTRVLVLAGATRRNLGTRDAPRRG